jgi:hypothetical protein
MKLVQITQEEGTALQHQLNTLVGAPENKDFSGFLKARQVLVFLYLQRLIGQYLGQVDAHPRAGGEAEGSFKRRLGLYTRR